MRMPPRYFTNDLVARSWPRAEASGTAPVNEIARLSVNARRTRSARPDAPDDFFIQPSDTAEEIWHVVHQPRSAWSFNVEIRPFKESWSVAAKFRQAEMGHAQAERPGTHERRNVG